MAKSILKGIGRLPGIRLAGKALGIGKKKKAAEPAATAEQKGPIIKQLGTAERTLDPRRRRNLAGLQGQLGTILSDKLGA